MLTVGGLFSGIGGMELGLHWAGFETAWLCEIDPWCRDNLRYHFPGVEVFEDVRAAGPFPRVDVLAGGFPCQDVSSAGKRAGLDGARSGLWFEFRRHVEEIRPAAVIVENVASGIGRYLEQVSGDLVALGYRVRPLRIRARDCGAPHIRARIFILAVLADGDGQRFEGLDGTRPTREGLARPVLPAQPRTGADPDGDAIRLEPGRGEPGACAAEHRAAFQAARELRTRWRAAFGDVPDASGRRFGGAQMLCARQPEPGDGGGRNVFDPDVEQRRGGAGDGGAETGKVERVPDAGGSSRNGVALGTMPESRLGGAADGVSEMVGESATDHQVPPARLVRWRWPNWRNLPRHEWEPPPLIPRPKKGTNRRLRLKAFGNAVVPQVAFLAGLALIDWMADLAPPPDGQ